MLRNPCMSSFSCVNAVALTAPSCRRSTRRVAVTTISSSPLALEGQSPSAPRASIVTPNCASPNPKARAMAGSRIVHPRPPHFDGMMFFPYLPSSRKPGERGYKRRFLDNSAKLIHQCGVARPSVTLSTLRGFEAAARLASFALAANDLHLSHSAVSHQIKLLEEELGQPMFRNFAQSFTISYRGADS